MRLSSQNPGDLKALIQRQEEELIHLREEVEFLKEGKKLVIWKHREAAARIEQLEAALRYYACKCKNPHTGCAVEFERSGNARGGTNEWLKKNPPAR